MAAIDGSSPGRYAPPRPVPDVASDATTALVVGLGSALVLGLGLGLAGTFHPLPVTAAALAGIGIAAWRLWRPGAAFRTADGLLVFLLALAVYAPAYDTTLYGADATTYLGSGGYLARRGSFRIEAPLLTQMSLVRPRAQLALFPPYRMGDRRTRTRSLAGLAFEADGSGTVYSTFSKLPSVWLGLGFGLAGVAGANAMSPVLAAAATMAYYTLLRRTLGMFAALVAAGLLVTSLPQLIFARVSMGEIGGQFFLWGGLLALSRWGEGRTRLAAIAAGVGIGCAMLARPELLLFVPLAVVITWTLGIHVRAAGPSAILAVALGALAFGLLASLPTHYRVAVDVLLSESRLKFALLAQSVHPGRVVAGVLAVGLLAGWAVTRWVRGTMRVLRTVAVAAVVLWAVVYLLQAAPPTFEGARLLRGYVGWGVALAALPGVFFLFRDWRSDRAALLAGAIGLTAALHFVYDPHVAPLPLWAARRFVPAVLPLLFAAAAAAVGWIWRRDRRLGAAVALGLLVWQGQGAFPVWRTPFLRGTEAAAAGIASAIPEPTALVVIEPALFDALLDVPLSLLYGREAVQLRGAAGASAVVPLLAGDMTRAGRPTYLVQHAFLPPPVAPGVVYAEVANGSYPIVPLDMGATTRTQLLVVRIFRVTLPGVEPAEAS